MLLNEKETIEYVGGGSISASLVSAVGTLIKTLYSIGQDIGSVFNRLFNKTRC